MKPAKKYTKDQALLRMAHFCSRSEYSEYEIRQKLLKMRIIGSVSDEIIEYLTQERYIDNERYARAFANDKLRYSGWGRNKIRMALAAKRIPSQLIFEALDSLDGEQYMLTLMRVAMSKSRSLDLNEAVDRQRLYRHLLSRGFESPLISQALHQLSK